MLLDFQSTGFVRTSGQSPAQAHAIVNAPYRCWRKNPMTEDEEKERAAVLALIAKLPKDATIEDFNRVRLNIVFVPPQKRLH
jgi:hypothetical protein